MVFAGSVIGDEPKKEPTTGEKLIGTWKLASAKYAGQEFNFPEGTTTLKHVTGSQFMWVTFDGSGQVSRTAGGSYVLKGDEYTENPEYGFGPDFEGIKGKKQAFKCKIDGDTWHHDGALSTGVTIEEVWERVKAK
jgi:hypothetical protein